MLWFELDTTNIIVQDLLLNRNKTSKNEDHGCGSFNHSSQTKMLIG